MPSQCHLYRQSHPHDALFWWRRIETYQITYVTVLVLSVKHNYYNLLVSLFVYLATCFGPLFGHLQAILEGVYFLFTLLHLYYTYIYTTSRPVIRDILFVFYG
jgi:hypothetical protein